MEDDIYTPAPETWIRKRTRMLDPVFDHFVYRYLKWNYFLTRAPKKFAKANYSMAKGFSFILVFILASGSGDVMPPFMSFMVYLMLLLGIFHVFRSMYQFRSGYSYERKWDRDLGFGAAALSVFLLLMMVVFSAFFFLIVPALNPPTDLNWERHRILWPLMYLVVFLIWSLTAKAVIYAPVRAYIVGDRLARVAHDRMLSMGSGRYAERVRLALITGLVPVMGLALYLAMTILFRLAYVLASHLVFGPAIHPSVGEMTIRMFVPDFALIREGGPLGTWYGPTLLFAILVPFIGLLSYARTLFRVRRIAPGLAQSQMGRLISMVLDNISEDTVKGDEEDGNGSDGKGGDRSG